MFSRRIPWRLGREWNPIPKRISSYCISFISSRGVRWREKEWELISNRRWTISSMMLRRVVASSWLPPHFFYLTRRTISFYRILLTLFTILKPLSERPSACMSQSQLPNNDIIAMCHVWISWGHRGPRVAFESKLTLRHVPKKVKQWLSDS